MSSSPEPPKADKKRKRNIKTEDDDDKLEIDINLPEPPSKKAKRKEKKQSKSKRKTDTEETTQQQDGVKKEKESVDKSATAAVAAAMLPKRSENGIWIGNLPFSATKDSLRRFMLNEGGIAEGSVTRVHLPTNQQGQNKGFAYVDFTTPAELEIALTLSERVLEGRSVLIKNAKSFEGRPQKSAAEENAAGNVSKKEPSKRVFVGNLSFDVTKEELAEHFSQAGEVEDVFLATFQDTGKCKGFSWVTFADIESATAAVRGFVFKYTDVGVKGEGESDEELVNGDDNQHAAEKSKHRKPRKWFINRLHGRPLRCEFAEDPQTRYKKRYGKSGAPSTAAGAGSGRDGEEEENLESLVQQAAAARQSAQHKKKDPKMKHLDKDQRQEVRRKRHDARNTAPGMALANTQRASAAIVAAQGSKVTFD